MSNRKPVLVLTDNEQIKRMVRAAAPSRVDTICVSSMAGIVLPLTKGQISMAIVDLASRAISGDDLMAIARVTEGRDVPLLIMTRQPRQAVKALAAVLSARDVVSTTETPSLIGARLRMWLGPDPELDAIPLGFAIVPAGAAH
jgi:DNA-binding response OmpR family regulator